MKQVVQNYRTGNLSLEDVPAPICRRGGVVVRTCYSLVSTGTERMKVTQARMNLIAKARARPDKVKQVIDSVRQVGLAESMNKVRERLDALTPLGYSMAGIVEEVGEGIDDLRVGDLVACAGEGIACHAEFVAVPRNLCAKLPEGVDPADAAFATVGAIAMHGVRQASVSLGDTVLVVGLGLVGLLGVQILKAAGCKVIGVDLDEKKLALARDCGADLALHRNDSALTDAIEQATNGFGVDAAYIAASTKSADPMTLAGEVVRDRGNVVIVGMVPVEADWQTYYEKELNVILSRSYGPGRYDTSYEKKGIDYPIGYVRWTEGRNLEEFLRLVGNGSLQPKQLKPSVYPLSDAPDAYQALHEGAGDDAVAILFKYPTDAPLTRRVALASTAAHNGQAGIVNLALIGAGNFATATLIPAMKKADGAHLKAICSAGGLSARSAAGRHGFEYCTSEFDEILRDNSVHAVVIATRHDTHAAFAAKALSAGKHVFVEKPLALTPSELQDVIAAQQASGRILMPGYNRRFSPLAQAIRSTFAQRSSPIEIVCRVNAGALGKDSWYQDADEGGWRIVSEGCHFVDLIQFLAGAKIERVYAEMIGGRVAGQQNDNCMSTLRLEDGSIATLVYVANGDTAAGKERIEVFGQDTTAIIDNWKQATIHANGKKETIAPKGSGKGHAAEMAAFVSAIRTGDSPPIAIDDAINTSATTFAISESLLTERPIYVADVSARPKSEEATDG